MVQRNPIPMEAIHSSKQLSEEMKNRKTNLISFLSDKERLFAADISELEELFIELKSITEARLKEKYPTYSGILLHLDAVKNRFLQTIENIAPNTPDPYLVVRSNELRNILQSKHDEIVSIIDQVKESQTGQKSPSRQLTKKPEKESNLPPLTIGQNLSLVNSSEGSFVAFLEQNSFDIEVLKKAWNELFERLERYFDALILEKENSKLINLQSRLDRLSLKIDWIKRKRAKSDKYNTQILDLFSDQLNRLFLLSWKVEKKLSGERTTKIGFASSLDYSHFTPEQLRSQSIDFVSKFRALVQQFNPADSLSFEKIDKALPSLVGVLFERYIKAKVQWKMSILEAAQTQIDEIFERINGLIKATKNQYPDNELSEEVLPFIERLEEALKNLNIDKNYWYLADDKEDTDDTDEKKSERPDPKELSKTQNSQTSKKNVDAFIKTLDTNVHKYLIINKIGSLLKNNSDGTNQDISIQSFLDAFPESVKDNSKDLLFSEHNDDTRDIALFLEKLNEVSTKILPEIYFDMDELLHALQVRLHIFFSTSTPEKYQKMISEVNSLRSSLVSLCSTYQDFDLLSRINNSFDGILSNLHTLFTQLSNPSIEEITESVEQKTPRVNPKKREQGVPGGPKKPVEEVKEEVVVHRRRWNDPRNVVDDEDDDVWIIRVKRRVNLGPKPQTKVSDDEFKMVKWILEKHADIFRMTLDKSERKKLSLTQLNLVIHQCNEILKIFGKKKRSHFTDPLFLEFKSLIQPIHNAASREVREMVKKSQIEKMSSWDSDFPVNVSLLHGLDSEYNMIPSEHDSSPVEWVTQKERNFLRDISFLNRKISELKVSLVNQKLVMKKARTQLKINPNEFQTAIMKYAKLLQEFDEILEKKEKLLLSAPKKKMSEIRQTTELREQIKHNIVALQVS